MLSVIGIHLILNDNHDILRSDHFFMACAARSATGKILGTARRRIRILRTPYRVCILGYPCYPCRYIVPITLDQVGSKVTRPGNLETPEVQLGGFPRDFSREIDQLQVRTDSEVSGG